VKAWSRLGCGNIILPLTDFTSKNHVTACTEREQGSVGKLMLDFIF
jgi:hypothetical protein